MSGAAAGNKRPTCSACAVHVRNVCACGAAESDRTTAPGRSRGGLSVYACSVSQEGPQRGRGEAGWPHREADDPAKRQRAAQLTGTATPWRFVRLAWGWRRADVGAGVGLARGADAVLFPGGCCSSAPRSIAEDVLIRLCGLTPEKLCEHHADAPQLRDEEPVQHQSAHMREAGEELGRERSWGGRGAGAGVMCKGATARPSGGVHARTWTSSKHQRCRSPR